MRKEGEVQYVMKKPLPVGIEFYKTLIDNPYYYVDKTWMIKELLDKKVSVNLFTRPRRFGKTLVLSMLQTFFEKEIGQDGIVVDNSRYFRGMKIMEAEAAYAAHMGKYPVVFLSLKSAKQPEYEMAYQSLVDEIIKEYNRHDYILQSDCLSEEYRERYLAVMNRRADAIAYAKSLAFLSECLKRYHGARTIILLDEYDVPLENAFFEGFYKKMVGFIRSLFESALKTNENLEFAVVTGCLRISKESIFTGLNNLEINSILNDNFSEYFGFTQAEVNRMLDDYGINDRREEVRRWYDGYLFGESEVYNPWSVINYVKFAVTNKVAFPRPYWSNTSSNSIVRELVERADARTRGEIESLIAGGVVEKPVHDAESNLANSNGVQNELSARRFFEVNETEPKAKVEFSEKNILDFWRMDAWNFLFFTGYLKGVSQRFEEDTIYLTMKLPNQEVRYIYRNTIREWFEQHQSTFDLTSFYEAVKTGDCETMENVINRQLMDSISYYDNAENFYHGYLLGLLSGVGGYRIDSNKERGNGRPDILLGPVNPRLPAILFEVKRAKKFSEMEDQCEAALKQMEKQNYAAGLLESGIRKVFQYGICFCGKSCMVKVQKKEWKDE